MLSVTLFIFSVVFRVALGLINALPGLSLSLPADLLDDAAEFLNGVAFFLPMSSLVALFEIKITVINFRLAWSILLRIKSFIPEISST